MPESFSCVCRICAVGDPIREYIVKSKHEDREEEKNGENINRFVSRAQKSLQRNEKKKKNRCCLESVWSTQKNFNNSNITIKLLFPFLSHFHSVQLFSTERCEVIATRCSALCRLIENLVCKLENESASSMAWDIIHDTSTPLTSNDDGDVDGDG